MKVEDFDFVFGLNVRAAYFLAQAVARRLIDAKKSGSIINMSSQMGHVGGPTRTVYCATKHAMEGFTKAMAIELAPYKIRVNTLAPTFIETPMTRPFFQNEAFRTDTLNRIKLGRLGQLEDLTGARVSVAATGWQRRGDGADSRRRFSFFVFCRRQPVVTLSGLDADRAAELPGRSRWPPGPPICRHARAAVRARERTQRALNASSSLQLCASDGDGAFCFGSCVIELLLEPGRSPTQPLYDFPRPTDIFQPAFH